MSRWGLPIAQCVLALAMLPAIVIFGGLGLIPIIGTVLTSHVSSLVALNAAYNLAVFIASISVLSAFILCTLSAASWFRKPNAVAVRLSAAGGSCYFVFIASHLIMSCILSHQTLWHTFLQTVVDAPDFLEYSAWDYPIVFTCGLITFGLYRYHKQRLAICES